MGNVSLDMAGTQTTAAVGWASLTPFLIEARLLVIFTRTVFSVDLTVWQ
jgi:hypothetical protein